MRKAHRRYRLEHKKRNPSMAWLLHTNFCWRLKVFGAVFPDFTRCGRPPQYVSIFKAELAAIPLALCNLYLLQMGRYIIYCDSTAAISATEIIYFSHPLVIQIFMWIILCHRRGHNVNFCWVSAHVYEEGNGRPGEVSKSAAFRPAYACPFPFKELFPPIRSAIQTLGRLGGRL